MSSNDAIAALRAAGSALGDVDVSGWDEAALNDKLAELSDALCQLDAQVSRVADAVRARGFRVAEPVAA
ncbi:hypothetical protein ACFQFC_17550 [Amorphoplanes digitatis]|uniref:Uncharacterized protein n=1 Tax=Actinoplanes digitatis TaxID=1868 RepID=A0A7W7I401_9ACTN|nr:hypothetical protein [Actinoplanes digitatis]MBB4766020.1 hypothetical protein [Actinoplanes digitatis]BFE75990.1 hypothetical protein GCM10020092_092910 [Actinoplanes digitatis]GID97221.1 hypothetical protein Adi01nite_66330 [Actinoplanes digitatis]